MSLNEENRRKMEILRLKLIYRKLLQLDVINFFVGEKNSKKTSITKLECIFAAAGRRCGAVRRGAYN